MKLTNKTYDIISWISKLVPLLVTLVGAILTALGVGEATINSVLMILGACGTFLNGLLEISKQYFNANNTITIKENTDVSNNN